MKPIFGSIKTGLLVAAGVMLGLTQASLAQSPNWAPVTGPSTPGYGGLIRLSQGTPDGVAWIMTEGGGVHKSTDVGVSWTASNNGLTNLRIKSGVINTSVTPYSVYAGTYGGGVFKSVDAGANWRPINTGLGCSYVTALTGLTSRLLAGTDCQSASGVYFADTGQAWSLATGLPGNIRVNSINRINSTSFGVDFLLANTDSGIYKSLNSGSSWSELPTSPSGPNGAVVYNVRALFYTPTGTTNKVTRLLATVEGAGVFVSEDGGTTWAASNTGLPANPVPAAGMRWDSNTSTLYLSLDGDGTYKSNNRGASWTLAFSDSLLPGVRGVSPSALTAGALVAETLAGLRKSLDGGVTWLGAGSTGLPGGWTNNLKMDNAGSIYVSAADGVYKLNGTQWFKMPPLPNMSHGQVKVRGSTVYATTSNKGVFKFDATNNTWQAINAGLPTNLVGRNPKFVGDSVNANNTYLGLNGDGVYYTSNAGVTWTARNNGLTGNALFVNSLDAYGALVYIATDAGVFKSTDGGANWSLVFAPKNAANQTVPSGHIAADPVTNSTVYIGVFNTDALGNSLPSNGVYKSTDAGASWTQLVGMAGKKVADVRFVGTSNADLTLIASAWDEGAAGGLFSSNDGGATWTRESTGLTTNLINSAIAKSTGGYVATRGEGLFKFDNAGTGGGFGSVGTVNVVSGWNLLGNSVEAPIAVATSLSDPNKVTTVWKWLPGAPATATSAAIPSGWAFYSPGLPDGGVAYAASKGYSPLTTINAGEGFWVNALNPFSLTVPAGASVASSSFKPALTNPVAAGGTHALVSGWSLVATGDNPTPAAFDAALSTVVSTPPAAGSSDVYTNLTTLWAWSTAGSGGWYFWAPALVNNNTLGTYIASKQYVDFGSTGTLAPGVGFWVNMP